MVALAAVIGGAAVFPGELDKWCYALVDLELTASARHLTMFEWFFLPANEGPHTVSVGTCKHSREEFRPGPACSGQRRLEVGEMTARSVS